MTYRSMPFALAFALAATAFGQDGRGPTLAERDPVLWQIAVDRAELRLAKAEADAARRREVLQWIDRLPPGEELGRLDVNLDLGPFVDRHRAIGTRAAADELAVAEAEAAATLRRLELDEMLVCGNPFRDGRWVPLVNGVDYAGDRMQVRLGLAERRREHFRARVEMLRFLSDARATTSREVAAAEDALDVAEARADELRLDIEMRELHLAGDPPDDATFVLEDAELARRDRLLSRRLARATRQRDAIVLLHDRGVASHLDLDAINDAVREIEHDIAVLDLDRRSYEYRYRKWLDARGR